MNNRLLYSAKFTKLLIKKANESVAKKKSDQLKKDTKKIMKKKNRGGNMKAKDIIEKYIKKSMRDNVDVIVLKFDSSTQEHTIHHLLAKEELPKKGCGITVIRIREAGYTGKVGK